jgi:biopolymer transport protein ExbB/TolQ
VKEQPVLIQARCPHCRQPTAPGAYVPGAIIDCEGCDQSFVVADFSSQRAEDVAESEMPSQAKADADEVMEGGAQLPREPGAPRVAASSDIALSGTGLVAAVLTVVFYIALVKPLGATYFGALFGARGWVPYVISFLSIWSGVLLVAKYRLLTAQTRVLQLDLLPSSIAGRITPSNAPAFISRLQTVTAEYGQSFLVQRICQGLEHFCARANVAETVDQLRSQAEHDEGVVESSYTMLRVFIWAIPILGFIGTVLGIGASVGGFSESVSAAADLDVMKDSIGTVTSGLGVAFDTTLLALVMSIFIMFPTSSLQKAEEDYLGGVDDYCRQHLIARLDDGEAAALADRIDSDLVRQVADRIVGELVAAFERRMPEVE